MTAEEKRQAAAIANRAAEQAVRKTLLALGIDASTPVEVRETQQDFAFLRRTRVAAGLRSTKLVLAGIGAFVTFVGAIALFVIQKFWGN